MRQHLFGVLIFPLLALSLVSFARESVFANPPRKVIADPNSVYAGFYNIASVVEGYESFVSKSDGNAPAIVFTFHDWNSAGVEAKDPVLQTFADPMEGEERSPLELANAIAEDGSVPAVAWEAIGYFYEHPDFFAGGGTQAVKFDDIFDGRFDTYIREVAREIKDFGKPIMLSPAGEFNSIGYFSFGPNANQAVTWIDDVADLSNAYGDPNVPDGPERIRDLYRYVIDIFRDEGVNNVTWFMYSHTAYMNPDDLDADERARLDYLHPRHYYPGDEYIDWIGASAYVDADNSEFDLDFAVSDALAAFREVTERPYFIPEFGVVSASVADRSERMRVLFDDELPAIDDIRAFAFADGELWAQFFDVPLLGHVEEELDVWREQVWDSEYYTGEVKISEVPEPTTQCLFVIGAVAAAAKKIWAQKVGLQP